MNIKFVDLVRQNKQLKAKLMPIIEKVIDDADFILGKSLEKFEQNFAQYCGKKFALGINSGTDALKLALIAYGIGQDDEVITVPNSYFSATMIISQIGAIPVFVDIDPETFLLDFRKLKNALLKIQKRLFQLIYTGK